MIVAGVMSGTSGDGINVALVQISGSGPLRLLGHAEFPYPKNVRKAVSDAMNATSASVADLARLNFLLGELYAEAVLALQKKISRKANLVGCHGQTLYHQGTPKPFLGRRIATTWQTGEGAISPPSLRVRQRRTLSHSIQAPEIWCLMLWLNASSASPMTVTATPRDRAWCWRKY